MSNKRFKKKLENDKLIQRFEKSIEQNEFAYFSERDLEKIITYYQSKKAYTNALIASELGVELYKFSSLFYQFKAEVLLETKKHEEALEILEHASSFAPSELSIFLLKADIYVATKMYNKALSQVKEAFRFSSEEEKIDLYLECADIYNDWGKIDKVMDCLLDCLLIDENNIEALPQLFFTIDFENKQKKGVEVLKKLLEKYPFNPYFWYELGHCYSILGEYEKAIDSTEYAIALDSSLKEALVQLAELHTQYTKNYEKALNYYLEHIEFHGINDYLCIEVGNLYLFLNDFKSALTYCKKAIDIAPQNANGYYLLSKVYIECKQYKEAIISSQKAIKIEPENEIFSYHIATIYMENKAYEEAYRFFSRGIIIKENELRNYVGAIKSLVLLEVFEKAHILIEAASEYCHLTPLLYIHAAVVYYYLGKRELLLDSLDKSLTSDIHLMQLFFDLAPLAKNDCEVLEFIETLNS